LKRWTDQALRIYEYAWKLVLSDLQAAMAAIPICPYPGYLLKQTQCTLPFANVAVGTEKPNLPDPKPVPHPHILWQVGVLGEFVHAMSEGDFSLPPIDGVREVYGDRAFLSDVHAKLWIGGDGNLDHPILMVQYVKMDVREEVPPGQINFPWLHQLPSLT
jgi:hypothetical protein